MPTETPRRRAPAMRPEQRRDMIVQAALPLLAEHGATVTTQQVARAAGIGEATIFRAFADKDALLDACVAEALRPDNVLVELASIPLDQPLRARLIEAADALLVYLGRVGAVIGALQATGRGPQQRPALPFDSGGRSTGGHGRDAAMAETRAALAELFEPDAAALRLPAERLARVFLGLLFVRGRDLDDAQPPVSTSEIVDLFLHGAVSTPDGPPVAIALNHIVVSARDNERAARFFADIMGLRYAGTQGHFAPVRINDQLTLDFLSVAEPPGQHLAFDVAPATFDAILARLRERGVPYGNDPSTPDNGRLDHPLCARGLYFAHGDHNLYEVMSVR